jgi:membrane-anchored glycerophosphoryl diester phosphodiesterase (GDPDase)
VTLSIGKAWEETAAFLGSEARLVVPVALATFALPSVLAGWALPDNAAPGDGGWTGLLLLVLVLLAVMVGQMTIILLALGWKGSVGDALRKAVGRLWALLAASLMVFLPLCLVAVIAIGTVLAGAGITDPAQLTPESMAKVPNIGWVVLLLGVVLIFIGTRLFPMSAVAAAESAGPVDLIRRSWALTKGNFWRLFALLLLLLIAALVLDRAATSVVGLLATIVTGEPRPFNVSALLVALASGLVGAAVSAVSASMVGRVYAQLTAAPAAKKKA